MADCPFPGRNLDSHMLVHDARISELEIRMLELEMKLACTPDNTSEQGDEVSLIKNQDFSGGLLYWLTYDCDAILITHETGNLEEVPSLQTPFILIRNRREYWHGLQQDITNNVSPNTAYSVRVLAAISNVPNGGAAAIRAFLKIQYEDSSTEHFSSIGRLNASCEKWMELKGSFCLASRPHRALFCIDGPPAGIHLLIKSIEVSPLKPTTDNPVIPSTGTPSANIILNGDFSSGLLPWFADKASARVVSAETGYPDELGGPFALVQNRKLFWSSLKQDVTARISYPTTYTVSAVVGVSCSGTVTTPGTCCVQATVKLTYGKGRYQYVNVARTSAAVGHKWTRLEGEFFLGFLDRPEKAEFYIEGPSPGMDLLIKSVVVSSIHPSALT